MSNNQKGFGAVGIIVIVVVLALIGGGGWYVWQANNKPRATVTDSQALAPTGDNGSGGDTKYLTIKEWGIKFSLTTDTADAYYDSKTSSPLESLSLRSHSLDASNDCKDGSQSVATIFRVPKDTMNQDGQSGKMYRETQEGKVIDGYFYFISGAQYGCTDDPELAVILQGVRNSFVTAGATIQKNE